MLDLDGVVKHYQGAGELVRAVDGVSLSVHAGEMVALHGPSGSGKTSLLLLAAGLTRPERGVVRYNGRNLAEFSDEEASDYRMREIGFVWQSAQLMARVSAIENAAIKLVLAGMGARKAQAQARPWLERLGMGERAQRIPEELSSGERQRVALARALACGPRMVLADEPTANLDSGRSGEIMRMLHEVAHEREMGVLVVTHDVEAAATADRSLTLRDGRLDALVTR